MTDFNLLKILVSGLVLNLALCPQAFGATATPCGTNESNCWTCGADCTARLDSKGKLTVEGTGDMYDFTRGNPSATRIKIPWLNQMGSIKSIEIKDGITRVGGYICDRCPSLTNVSIPDSVTSMGDWLFSQSKLESITVPKNVTEISGGFCAGCYDLKTIVFEGELPSIANGIFGWGAPHSEVAIYYLGKDGEKEELETILANMDPWGGTTTSTFLQAYIPSANGGKDLLDENGKISKTIGINGETIKTYSYDSQGRLYSVLDASGEVLSVYAYNPDGSIFLFDANGKLTGLKNARAITPAQAAELTKPGKNNTVTLTFK